MDFYKELEKYQPYTPPQKSDDTPSFYIEKFNTLLNQLRGFTKQQLKTVQEVELIRDGINQKAETDQKLYQEALDSKSLLERQKSAILGRLMNIADMLDSFAKLVGSIENTQLNQSAATLQNEVQKQLKIIGFIAIKNTGELINPSYHYTVGTRWDGASAENHILEIVRPGYLFEGEVIRKADVIVNQKGA